MNKKLRFSLLALLMAVFSGVWAQEVVYDFTGSGWSVSNGQLTNGTVTFTGQGGANFKMNDGYFMMGKSGAYLTLPTYDFKVEKIEIDGRSGASAAVVQNIFVGNDAVSTATTGATGTNTYVIDTDYQDAGTFTLKVTSNHNTQITAIRVYKVADTRTPVITGGEITPTSLIPGQEGTFGVSDVTFNGGAAVHWASSDEDVIYVDEETGEFIAGDAEGDATISVTYVANDQTNYSDVTITAEVFVVDSREAIATINSFPYTEMTVNSDYPGLTADLELAEGVSEGDYEVTFETESDLLMIEDDYCYVGNEAGTAVITVTVTPNDLTTYKPVSRDFTITIVDPNAPGTENNPFTVAEAIEFIDGLNGATSSEVYAKGIICQVDNINNGAITYWISDDGTTDNKFEVYKGKSFNGAAFQAVTDLAVGDEVTVAGYMKKYNTTYEFDQNSRLVALVHREPVVTINSINTTEINTNAEGTFTVDLTPADNTLVNGEDYEVTYSTESDLIVLDADGSYLTGETAGSAVITVTVTALDSDTYNDVTKDFTVNIIAPVQFVEVVNGCGLYQKVTSNDQLAAGHRYLIVYDEDATAGEGFEVFNGVSNKLGQVTPLGNETNFANKIIDAREATAIVPVVLQAGDNSNWYMMDGETFINYTGTSNNIYTSNVYYTDGNLWTIDVEGDHFITSVANNDRSIRYNPNVQNGVSNPRFACYKSTSNLKDAVLYVELEEVPVLNLSENDTEQQIIESGVYPIVNFTYAVKAGWNTVAMPFEGIDITDIMSDVKVYEFTGLSDEGDLNFSEFTGEFEPCKPYVFYSESETESNEHEFQDVNVIYEMGMSNEYFFSTLYRMSMAGLYGVVPSTGQIKKGGANSFIKGFRGYFDLPAESGDAVQAVFHNEDGTTTAIKAVELFNETNGNVYDLSGRKVSGNLQPGVYVKDGKKVVVK